MHKNPLPSDTAMTYNQRAMNILNIRPSLLLAFTLLITPVANAADLDFENVWIAEAPPVSKVLAAYMDIKNPGKQNMKIVAASSEDFGKIELHRTIEADGMATMQQQHELLIPAGGELKLEPNSYHLMLFRPVKPLPAGTRSSFSFELANGKTIKIAAEVKKAGQDQSHEHHHHH